jgi:predicted transcriptional regulator
MLYDELEVLSRHVPVVKKVLAGQVRKIKVEEQRGIKVAKVLASKVDESLLKEIPYSLITRCSKKIKRSHCRILKGNQKVITTGKECKALSWPEQVYLLDIIQNKPQ